MSHGRSIGVGGEPYDSRVTQRGPFECPFQNSSKNSLLSNVQVIGPIPASVYEFVITLGREAADNTEMHELFAIFSEADINIVSVASAFHYSGNSREQTVAIVIGGEEDPERVSDLLYERGPSFRRHELKTAVLKDEPGALLHFAHEQYQKMKKTPDSPDSHSSYRGFDTIYIIKTDEDGVHIGYSLK
jgi:hypothetical protein